MSPPDVAGAELGTQIATPALRWPRFFNGRLLTGEDLAGEQSANRAARAQLGRALGTGVAFGLEVAPATGVGSAARPVLSVQAGLAVNPRGEPLELPCATTVALAAAPPDPDAPDDGEGDFTLCRPPAPGTGTPTTGVFVLTIGPRSATQGRAPVSGLGDEPAACNVKWWLDGVAFALCSVALPNGLEDEPDMLRNRLAHLCFGTVDPARLSGLEAPFAHGAGSYGVLDGQLPDDQVPLALLRWTLQGLEFVDCWSVRRRLTALQATSAWPQFAGARRRAEAEAMLAQFEDEIELLRVRHPGPDEVAAADRFAFLPPAGLLPVAGGSLPGFDAPTFFGEQGSRDVAQIDAERVPALMHDSFRHEPIAVDGEERIQLYRIRENELAVAAGQVAQPAILFAKRSLPYRGVARFGDARFDLSRYATRVI
jgi:hypothetical protein